MPESVDVAVRVVDEGEYIVSQWSGGITTQLCIEPQGADFKERSFDFRISSASFACTESEFSDFSGYQRFILPLKGEILLSHTGKYERRLAPYEVEKFDGSWKTGSVNTPDCIDFNLIARDGVFAEMKVFAVGEQICKTAEASYREFMYLYSDAGFEVLISENFVFDGILFEKQKGRTVKVGGGNLLEIKLNGGRSGGSVCVGLARADSEVVLCSIRLPKQ